MNLQQLLLPASFFRLCETSRFGHAIKFSQWDFAILETLHIMGIAVLLGSTLVVDLRLLGLGMRRQSVAQLAEELAPWTWGALALMIATGIPMFFSEAVRMSLNDSFFFKMIFLVLAISIQWTIYSRAKRSAAPERAGFGKLVACLSLICWLSVALAGRGIAFIAIFVRGVRVS